MLNLAAVAASVCRVATRAEVLARPQAFFFSRGWRKIDAAVIYDTHLVFAIVLALGTPHAEGR